jgi:hypothetical protein
VVTVRTTRVRWHDGALIGSSVVAGRWQGATGEVAGPQGGRRARWLGSELTRTAVRCGGGGEVSGQRRSLAGIELRWLVAMEAQPYSVGAEEGR